MKTAIYMRVSTSEQNTDMQRIGCLAYVQSRGFSPPLIFEDVGVSGAKIKRPGLDRMMTAIRNGEIDCVVVYSFSRFARSTAHLLSTLEEFKSLNVTFVSITEQIDTASPMGRAFFTVIAAIGQLERELIVDRVKSGLAAARARGVILGRKRTFDIQEVLKLRKEGLTIREISKQLGISFGSVQSSLKCGRISSM